MSDWERLVTELPFIVQPGTAVDVGTPHPWNREPVAELPELSALLAGTTVTPVVLDDARLKVVAWNADDERRGWLCPEPIDASTAAALDVHPVHRALLTRFGGVTEMFGAPQSWWSPNHSPILTADAAAADFASAIHDYSWIWQDNDLTIPIRPEDYYVVSFEANGNMTLAKRDGGDGLLLFAPDHAYDDITVLAGCPEYSLYTIDGLADLTTWIEHNALSWVSQ